MPTSYSSPNVSADLIWEIARSQNAYLVKRKQAGGVQFSRDPLNLTNEHSRKHAGFVNDKAVGVNVGEEKGQVHVVSKKDKHSSPASNSSEKTFEADQDHHEVYKNVAGAVSNKDYRPDLHEEAIARASAIKLAAEEKEDPPGRKPRGPKAKKSE